MYGTLSCPGYMQTEGARAPTMDLLTAGQPALPPEPQLLQGLSFYVLGVIPFTHFLSYDVTVDVSAKHGQNVK